MNRKMVSLSANEINTIEIEAKDMAKELETLRHVNECLEEDNETLFKTNCMLIKELRDSKDKYNTIYEEYLLRINECNKLYGELQDAKQELRRLKNPRSCGMCITCIECRQSVGGEF